MEVHHHPDVEKKPFKGYLLEGLMIFIAVTLGFFAEGLREHLANNEKATKNIESIVKSVALDTTRLNDIIDFNKRQIKGIDSFVSLGRESVLSPAIKWKYYYYTLNYLYSDVYFFPDNSGIEQLKSSGGLNLIKDQTVADTILHYDNFNKLLVDVQQADNHFIFEQLLTISMKVLDISVIKNPSIGWLSGANPVSDTLVTKLPAINNDPLLLKQFLNYATTLSISNNIYAADLKNQLERGRNLISYLKSKYDLDDK